MTAVVICAVFAVVTEPKRVVKAPLGRAETVTVVLAILAVTVPATVTVLPMVTDEMLTGTVPLMLAVTVPEIAPIVTDGVPRMLTDPVTVVRPDESTRMALRFVPSDPPYRLP